jgi:glycine cleavage system H protein
MSAAKDVKDDRKYTKDHEWAKTESGEVVVGITAFAVDQLGDITLVSIDVKPGTQIEAGKTFGTIESVKTLSDLFAPISGKVTRVNGALEEKPELVNDDCWGEGWMIAIAPSEPLEKAAALLDKAAYQRHLEESAH